MAGIDIDHLTYPVYKLDIMQGANHFRDTGITGLIKVILILLIIITEIDKGYAQKEQDVIRNKWLEYDNVSNSLYNHIADQAYLLLNQREKRISELKTLGEWQQWQKMIRETLMDIVGPFPEKTPLNSRITRSVDKGSYKVEHIIFESMPGFYVTSSLYIPGELKKHTWAPAVIYCSGHSADGYRNPVYQHVILNLVRKGFIVFAFDPVGQGERLQYYDQKTGKSLVGPPTSEHCYSGSQAFVTGSSLARYMIWDGIRSVDYILTRKEVDPSRIGITGRSGGGTQSIFIAAFDDRLYAIAPENYLTNFTRLFQTIGPQDAEQNMYNIICRGLDHPDYLIVRAPKPALMITTTRDMFSIQGAMETEREVFEAYKAYGKPENFLRVEDDEGHASTKKNREAMYAFFQKYLNNPGNPTDEEIRPLTNEELQVTTTGQISTSLGGETIFSLNCREAERCLKDLSISRANPDIFIPGVISSAKNLSGYMEPSADDEPVFTGRFQRGNYTLEKYFIKGEGNYIIPYLLFKPAKPANKYMLYLDPSGKSAGSSDGGEIERFINLGITVLAPDMIGTGEVGPESLQTGKNLEDTPSFVLWYASILTGRSITGIQAGDAVKLVRLLRKCNSEAEIIGFARKEMAPVLMHAAAFCNDFGRMILDEPYSSYMSIAMNRSYNQQFLLSVVPGAVKKYDLPDLAASFAPRKLLISGIVDGNDSTLNNSIDLEIIKSAYKKKNVENQLQIVPDISGLDVWLK